MKFIRWFLLMCFKAACKDKYNPEIHLPSSGLLVVEGFINSGTGPTTISLSRTAAIDHITEMPECGAQIEIQSETGWNRSKYATAAGLLFSQRLWRAGHEQAAFILGASAACVDCRIKGGSPVRPDFWY